MRALVFIFIILSLMPLAAAYDLDIDIIANGSFIAEESCTYKIFIDNLDESPPEYINFTVSYWISDDSGIISTYPKEKSDELKTQNTITRSFTPKHSGEFEICANITESNADDSNQDNDFACKEIEVEGNTSEEDDPDEHDLDETATGDNESLNDTDNETIALNNSSSNVSNNSTNNVSSSSKTNASKASISTKAVSSTAETTDTSKDSETNEENLTGKEEKKVIYQSKSDRLKNSALYLMIGLFVLLFFYLFKSDKI